MEKFDPIDIEFLINSDQVKIEARKVKQEIQGINKSAQSETKNLLFEHERVLKGVRSKYKGVVADGITAFNELDRNQQITITQLYNTDEALKEVGRAQKQLSIDYERGRIKVVEYTKAQSALAVQEMKLRQETKSLGAELRNVGGAGGVVANQKVQWDGLGNSINQMTREIPAFTYSAQTGFMALSNNIPILADEIGRLKSKNDALIASGQKGVPVWKQVVKGLLSWQTALSLGVALLTVYGAEIISWVGNVFKAKEALDAQKKSVEALNKAYESSNYQNVIKDITELRSMMKLAKEGLIDKKVALEKYNSTMGEAYKKTDDLNEAERIMVDKAPAYIEAMLYKAAAAEAMSEAAKAMVDNQKNINRVEDEQTRLEKEIDEGREGIDAANSRSGFVNPNPREKRLENLDEELKDLEEEGKQITNKSQEIIDNFNKKAAEIANAAGLTIFGSEDNDPKSKVLNDRKKLLEKIADLDREYARKQLDRDEEELQALRDKFLKVNQLIEEFNQDPKNATKKIDITGLGIIQEKAEADLIYKQDTRALKEELGKQKSLYKEIEEFKAKFGLKKTKERYGEELKKYHDFAAVLRQEVINNQSAFDAVEDGTATAAESERVRLLQAAKKEEQKIETDKYFTLLEEYMAYQEKRKVLIERYQKEYSQLILGQNFEEAALLKKMHGEELDALDDAHLKKKESYKQLFAEVGRLTVAAGKEIIADAKKLLQTEKMSAETRKKILKLIADTEAEIQKLNTDKIYKIASAMGALGESLNQIGNDIGNPALSNIGGFLSNLANGAETLVKALNFDSESDPLDVLATGLTSVINLISMVTAASAKRKAAEEEYYRSVIGFQNDYNLSLQEQIRLQSIMEESVFIKDYEGRITDANKALIEANLKFQEAMAKLEEGRVKTGQRDSLDWGSIGVGAASGAALGATLGSIVPIIGNIAGAVIGGIGGALTGLFGGKKKKDIFGDLLTEYPDLLKETEDGVLDVNEALAESLIENDLLDEATKQIVQNILDWKNALDEARAQIREVITDLTGSLSDDLRNSLVDAFKSGEDAALAMGNTVEKVLENIVSNLIFNRIFSDAFSKLENDMAASYDVGGDENWVDDFSRFFNEASGLSEDFNQAMQDAQAQAKGFGFDIFNPEDSEKPAGLQGAIRRELTEETGSELTGLFRGQYDITKRHLQLHERHFELEQRHYNTTLSIMQSSALIEQNTAATVVQLQYAVSELKTISKQTKGSQSSRDLGKG